VNCYSKFVNDRANSWGIEGKKKKKKKKMRFVGGWGGPDKRCLGHWGERKKTTYPVSRIWVSPHPNQYKGKAKKVGKNKGVQGTKLISKTPGRRETGSQRSPANRGLKCACKGKKKKREISLVENTTSKVGQEKKKVRTSMGWRYAKEPKERKGRSKKEDNVGDNGKDLIGSGGERKINPRKNQNHPQGEEFKKREDALD